MNAFVNTMGLVAGVPDEVSNQEPNVYFHEINRLHVNKFRAYVSIINSQLNPKWRVADDPEHANIQATYANLNLSNQVIFELHTRPGDPDTEPALLGQLELSLDEQKLVRQLNRASKKLSSGQDRQNSYAHQLCGKPTQLLSRLTNHFNRFSEQHRFKFDNSLFNAEANLFHEKILIVIDPASQPSIQAYETLLARMHEGMTINELTVVILKRKDESQTAAVFDQIYDNCDDNTQITLLDVNCKKDIQTFFSYFLH